MTPDTGAPAVTEQEFRDLLARKVQAVQAAQLWLIERVREFVAEHGRGPKAGREDYTAIIRCNEIHRITVALDEYDRMRKMGSGAFTPPPVDS